MKLGDVSLHIKVGQDTLGEYDVTVNEEAKEATCWIASEVGAEFSVSVDNGLTAYGLHCLVKVDGRSTHPAWVHPLKTRVIEGASVAADAVLPLLFSPIQLTDDESARRGDIPNINALGTIQVLVRRGVVNRITSWGDAKMTTLTDLGPLHERTKKAGAHCITVGNQRTVTTMTSVHADYIDKPDAPYCTFLFRYRPRDILQAQGIIPPQPILPAPEADAQQGGRGTVGKRRRDSKEPGDSEVKEESDDDGSDEDPDALQARLDAMSADMEALRAQMSQAKNKRERKRVKREPSPIRLETSGAVIDLTLD